MTETIKAKVLFIGGGPGGTGGTCRGYAAAAVDPVVADLAGTAVAATADPVGIAVAGIADPVVPVAVAGQPSPHLLLHLLLAEKYDHPDHPVAALDLAEQDELQRRQIST